MAKFDAYAYVNDNIISQLDKGIIPWKKPWSVATNDPQMVAVSHSTGRAYSLLNQMLLGLRHGEYLTYIQAQKEGGHVKKGAKASTVVFWKILGFDELGKLIKSGDKNTKVAKTVPMLQGYSVFHIDDCEGIKPKFEKAMPKGAKIVPNAEEIVKGYTEYTGLNLERDERRGKACYSPQLDRILVPCFEQYEETSEYYSTLFHEMAHSTGHESRLNRFDGKDSTISGFDSYSKEELVAEMTATMLCAYCGINNEAQTTNSIAYLQNWGEKIKQDRTLIVSAASKAEKAFNYILDSVEKNAALNAPLNEEEVAVA